MCVQQSCDWKLAWEEEYFKMKVALWVLWLKTDGRNLTSSPQMLWLKNTFEKIEPSAQQRCVWNEDSFLRLNEEWLKIPLFYEKTDIQVINAVT